MEEKKQKTLLKVNIPDHLKVGVSSNIVMVTSTSNGEVILDFIFAHPNDKQNDTQVATVVSRVVLPVKVAKDLNLVLTFHVGKIRKE